MLRVIPQDKRDSTLPEKCTPEEIKHPNGEHVQQSLDYAQKVASGVGGVELVAFSVASRSGASSITLRKAGNLPRGIPKEVYVLLRVTAAPANGGAAAVVTIGLGKLKNVLHFEVEEQQQ